MSCIICHSGSISEAVCIGFFCRVPLAEALPGSEASGTTTRATIALPTWPFLTGEEGLDDEECVQLFARTIREESGCAQAESASSSDA